jgi:SAM-dependent methyltransferase
MTDTQRIGIEEIYEDGGLTAVSFSGLSQQELDFLNTDQHGGIGAHVYGDTDADLLLHLFSICRGGDGESMAATQDDVFIDLGSGSGKLLLSMLLLTRARCVGIELSPTRHEQALAARSEALKRRVLPADAGDRLEFSCASMLRHPALSRATLIFCYNQGLSQPFLDDALRPNLEADLPSGALVVLRGKNFGSSADERDRREDGGHRRLVPVLETRITNRMHQFYVWRLQEEGEGGMADGRTESRVAEVVELEQTAVAIGVSTRFRRSVFAAAAPDEEGSVLFQELLENDRLV